MLKNTVKVLISIKIFKIALHTSYHFKKVLHYLMGIEPNTKKSPRIAESRFGHLKVCSSIVQCQKNPKKQVIGEKSQNLFFQGEPTT